MAVCVIKNSPFSFSSLCYLNPFPFLLLFGVQGGDTDEPMYCHQICDTTEPDANGVPTLILACISCDNIPQMSNISVMWQVI